jgi:hypothetical protein
VRRRAPSFAATIAIRSLRHHCRVDPARSAIARPEPIRGSRELFHRVSLRRRLLPTPKRRFDRGSASFWTASRWRDEGSAAEVEISDATGTLGNEP